MSKKTKKTNALRLLDQQKISYEIIQLKKTEEYGSALETAEQNGLNATQIFKTLVTKGDKTGVVVAVLSGDRQLNLKALAKASDNKKMAMLPLKELTPTTGYVRGGCSPIGMKKHYPVILDEKVWGFQEVYVNAGSRGILMKIAVQDLIRACQAIVADVSEE